MKLSEINNYRQGRGLQPFQKDRELCSLARVRVEEIKREWKHNIPLDECLSCTEMGETLARRFHNDGDVLKAWIKSPSHNQLLLADYTYACIEEDSGYYTLLMANKVLGGVERRPIIAVLVLSLVISLIWRVKKIDTPKGVNK